MCLTCTVLESVPGQNCGVLWAAVGRMSWDYRGLPRNWIPAKDTHNELNWGLFTVLLCYVRSALDFLKVFHLGSRHILYNLFVVMSWYGTVNYNSNLSCVMLDQDPIAMRQNSSAFICAKWFNYIWKLAFERNFSFGHVFVDRYNERIIHWVG